MEYENDLHLLMCWEIHENFAYIKWLTSFVNFFCNCICNALGIVYPCVTLLFYSSSLNSMIFEKYNSQQVYFDVGTLYFLVLQCIHHFHSFMNSNVSRYTRHSTIHWNAPNVSKFIVAFQRTPLNKSYIQTICISTFYIRGVGVYIWCEHEFQWNFSYSRAPN